MASPKTLDEVIRDVVFDDEITKLLNAYNSGAKNALPKSPYRGLVMNQIDEYPTRGRELKNAGYQIGEPWDGDIEKAKLLIISSNPAFEPNEKCMRYHAATNELKMPSTESTGSCYCDLNAPEVMRHEEETTILDDAGIKNLFRNNITPQELSNAVKPLRDYFDNRIQWRVSDEEQDNTHTLSIPLVSQILKNGQLISRDPVPYWNTVCYRIAELLPQGMPPVTQMTKAYIRSIMRKFAIMEIVPFRSERAKGVPAALTKCWADFAQHILANSGAELFIIFGKSARKAFEKIEPVAKTAFDNGSVYTYKDLNGRNRQVIWVDKSSGGGPVYWKTWIARHPHAQTTYNDVLLPLGKRL